MRINFYKREVMSSLNGSILLGKNLRTFPFSSIKYLQKFQFGALSTVPFNAF